MKISLRSIVLIIALCYAVLLVTMNFMWNPNFVKIFTGNVNPVSLDSQKQTIIQLDQENKDEKLWFMVDGTLRPAPAEKTETGEPAAVLFPNEDPESDRIVDQLMYIPPDYTDEVPLKKILVYNGLGSWPSVAEGESVFQICPVSRCTITTKTAEANTADAILFKNTFQSPSSPRPPNQIWVLYLLESPHHTSDVSVRDVFNWTSTYRHDSDLVAPYERWTYYDPHVTQLPQDRNYAANKTRKVAWFVSNCGARNNRLEYAKELQKYIHVDIYGSCGTFDCPRNAHTECLALLNNDYKFYLSFENSNCKDYITEKFFVTGLRQNVLPIVMGARPEEYKRSAPEHSYIHVDEFESPKELAAYLHQLDNDDDLYNSYFRWKGTGEFINTYFWCRLCAMMHHPISTSRYYEDVNDWWRENDVCTSRSWRKSTDGK